MNKPLLSILSITYNHEKFISQAIDSWLMQKTNFDIEIVIGEDCSTDNTLQIIKEYQKRYPHLIKIITSDTNVGMQANFIRTLEACNGKYIALCEGDDYWTDPLKLQKQVDFLENNEIYSIVGNKSKILKKDILTEEKYYVSNPVLISQWIGKLPFRTNTFVFRKEILDFSVIDLKKFISGDRIIMTLLLLQGPCFLIDEYMSVYRDHDTGISKVTDGIFVKKNEIKLYITLNNLTKGKYKKTLNKNIFLSYKYILEIQYKNKKIGSWLKYLILSLRYVKTVTDLKIFLKEYFLRLA